MKTSRHYLPVLLAGLLAAAGVQAQSTSASGSSDLPPKAGEMSTQSQGVPNAATTNSPVTEAPVSTKDAIRQDASGQSGASATTSVPGRAGEMSTTVQGRPNANPNDPMVGKSRAEVRGDVAAKRADRDAMRASRMMGSPGYGRMAGVPATLPEHAPSIFQGGTPQ
jgi:hypothetical protein